MVKAKKQFGQNFLKDEITKQKIIQAIPKNLEVQLIEIGPGLGDLTAPILASNRNLICYEIDTSLIPILNDRFRSEITDGRLKIINTDVMKVEISKEPYFICANLPYYISSQIILNALFDDKCKGLLVMVQKELADRFLGNDYCAISVLTSVSCSIKEICVVDPSCFDPAPKVFSSVILLEKNKNIFSNIELKKFSEFLKQAFMQPRKKMISSFKKDEKILNAYNTLGLSTDLRAHEVSVKSFLELFKLIKE